VLKRLVDITDAIYLATDRASLFRAVEDGSCSLGCPEFLLFCHKPSKQEMILNATLTNFHRSFLSDYERYEWAEDDFMLDLVLQTKQPLVWDTAQLRYEDMRKQSYIDFMHASRLFSGVVVPLQSRPGTASALAISSATNRSLEAGAVEAATIMAYAAMAKAEVLGLCNGVSADAVKALLTLSPIQQEILSWIGEGKSNMDIATIMEINERTVRYHVTEILRKLGVATRAQAVAIRLSNHFDPKA